jgi:Holliday junction resolvasome RuvABC endonuclease subunit
MLFDVLTVDPGMNTAYAFWKGDLLPVVGMFNTHSKKILTDYDKYNLLWKNFRGIITSFNPKKVVIENVRVYNSSHSMMAATAGDLIKLSIIVGGYCGICDREGISYRLISPQGWKGQLTKEATKAQVKLINGEIYKNDHITDAVAMGLAQMELFPYRSK